MRAYLSVALALVLTACAATAGETVVLDTSSYWRCRYTGGTDVARTEGGELVHVHPKAVRERETKTVDGKTRHRQVLKKHPRQLLWSVPAADWHSGEYDDGSWSRLRGPFLIGRYRTPQFGYRSVPMVCLRGRFRVDDPGRAGGLRLSMVYHGGVAVFVNGKEVTRKHLPAGELMPETLAEAYPDDTFLDPEGLLLDGKAPKEANAARHAKRLREMKDLEIPASVLRKGVNVLGLELHRAPAIEAMFMRKAKSNRWNKVGHTRYNWWSRVGVKSVALSAPAGSGVSGHAGAARPAGIQVWAAPIYQEIEAADYGDPCDLPGRVRLCTGRGGAVSGQVVASSGAEIKGMKATVSELKGPGTIPASAVQLRYARPGWRRGRSGTPIFMELEDFPADPVPVAGGGALQPIWLTVRVPADAKPGEYSGTLSVSAAGAKDVAVPVTLRVVDWRVPEPKNFQHSFLEFIQSPESVALHYKVKFWSEEHWKLLDRTFKLLGEVGNKVVYVTAQHKTHFGNEHSMIRYVKNGGGKYDYKPDFTVAERYLDLAVKHWGKVPVVGLYIWRAPWETGHYAGAGPRGDHKILITVKDPATGALSSAEGPEWGTPECSKFWKPVIEGMKKICADRGIGESLMLGQSGDYTPTDTSLADLDGAGGGDLLWIHHSHVTRTELGNMGSQPTGSRSWKRAKDGKTYPVGMVSRAWGGDGRHIDPEFGRGYGWKNRLGPWRTVNREHFDDHPLPFLRLRLEAMVTNVIYYKHVGGNKDYGTHGIGRLGADFWNVLEGSRGRKVELCGRFPETAWGQLKVSYCAQHFLRPGRDGALGTAPLEMLRESAQEIEARTFIEKALEDEAAAAKLGAELAARARALLDSRTRAAQITAAGGKVRNWRGVLALGVQELSEDLYATAAEVAAKLGTKGK
ncbi:MAG: glycoside hydrolase domain-containing protein [Planctomycetota bacterium]|jgi:hypothetical protein